jgi:ABC-type glutathione transport system ATPase component
LTHGDWRTVDQPEQFLVEIRDLKVTYFPDDGDPIHALDGVSIGVHPGEILGVLGESGSGKSTLAAALLRLLPPHAKIERGTVTVGGQDLLQISDADLRKIRGQKISLVSQDPAVSLNPVLPCGVQIGEVLRAHLPLSASQRRQRVGELLREVGFDRPDEIYIAYPHQLSGGQRQRVVIAQAVACRPALLIADEPTSKLDATLQSEIVELLAQIRRQHGMAMLFISHDPAIFARFADRIAVMYAGLIVEVGTSADIFRHPQHAYTQSLVRLALASVITGSKLRVPLPTIGNTNGEHAN